MWRKQRFLVIGCATLSPRARWTANTNLLHLALQVQQLARCWQQAQADFARARTAQRAVDKFKSLLDCDLDHAPGPVDSAEPGVTAGAHGGAWTGVDRFAELQKEAHVTALGMISGYLAKRAQARGGGVPPEQGAAGGAAFPLLPWQEGAAGTTAAAAAFSDSVKNPIRRFTGGWTAAMITDILSIGLTDVGFKYPPNRNQELLSRPLDTSVESLNRLTATIPLGGVVAIVPSDRGALAES